MPKINEYINTNKKPVEIVHELKDEYQIPSFEEFTKVYEMDEKVEDSYKNELGSYEDVRVGKGYGPGPILSRPSGLDEPNYESSYFVSSSSRRRNEPYGMRRMSDGNSGEIVSFVAKTAIKAAVATELTIATGGLAPLVGGGIWVGGKFLESRNNDFLQFLGRSLSDIGCDTFSSGLFSISTVGEFAEKSGVNLKKLENLFEVKGRLGTGYSIAEHNRHRNEGTYYKSSCDVCN